MHFLRTRVPSRVQYSINTRLKTGNEVQLQRSDQAIKGLRVVHCLWPCVDSA